MKNLYILILFVLCAGFLQAQPIPGQFEIRLIPGAAGQFNVEVRAIGSTIPTTDNFLVDLTYRIWWPLTVPVGDIDLIQSTTPGTNFNETTNPLAGTDTGTGGGIPGTVVATGLCGSCGFGNFPTNWVLNTWVNVGTINICTNNNCNPAGAPAGIDVDDFKIQLYVSSTGSPNINVDLTDFVPSIAAPLPLDLVAFNAEKSGERNSLLTWSTVNEVNTSHFMIQRSFDKKNWSNIGRVEAAGESYSVENYSFTDVNVYNGTDANLNAYYRLHMVDRDASGKVSPIESVVFGKGTTTGREFTVYPNPTSDGLQVTWDANSLDQPTSLEFYDIEGRLVFTRKVSDNTNQEYIDLGQTNLQAGLYLLRIMNGAEPLEHRQIVVQR